MATEEVIKLFLNGLYGKFAQSFLTESEAKELGVTTKRGGGTFKRIEDATPEEIEYTGANHPEYMIEGYVINKAVPTLKAFMNPILSSYVTARARVKLHSFIMRCLRESVGVLYTDTDSLYTTKPLEWASEAKELGTLGVGKQWDRITILGPKSKMLVELGDKPKRHYTTKGVPLKSFKVEDPDTMLTTKRKPRAALFDSLEEGKATTQYVKFLGFKEAMARGKVPNEIVEMRKTFDPFEFPKRKILGNPSLQDILKRKFETEPWEIREGVLQDGAPATG